MTDFLRVRIVLHALVTFTCLAGLAAVACDSVAGPTWGRAVVAILDGGCLFLQGLAIGRGDL
jgi:hypothetical protein